MRTLLVSTDPVAVDAAGARMLNLEPDQVAHIPLAAKLGLGTADLDQVEVRRIRLG
jgi:uncharacterized protein (DUF362 family)